MWAFSTVRPAGLLAGLLAGAVILSSGCSGDGIVVEEVAVPTPPDQAPPAITRKHASVVTVNLEVIEKVAPIAEGVDYTFWNFDNTAPGSFVRVRQGDQLVFRLRSHPDNRMPHHVVLRPVTGPGGGAASPLVAPGQASRFRFQATDPGVFLYHCATAPVGMPVANRMYGLVLVEPEEGLPELEGGSVEQGGVRGPLQRMLGVGGFKIPQMGPGDPGAAENLASRQALPAAGTPVLAPRNEEGRMALGRRLYDRFCVECHQANGQGIPGAFPPLAGSDYLKADLRRSIEIVTRGLDGRIRVNGEEFNGVMPAVDLTDDEVASVLTFVRKSWGNAGEMVNLEDVRSVRADLVEANGELAANERSATAAREPALSGGRLEAKALGWTPTPMVAVNGSHHRPFFPQEGEPEEVWVPGFRMEIRPVTNEQFLSFVIANPEWQRSRAKRLFVDESYLAHWKADLDLGTASPLSPVTNVSWFAARAYASWVGRRLPTLAEWELVAAAGASVPDQRDDPGFDRPILDWYASPASRLPGPVGRSPGNFWGVEDMHGLIWEWLDDFNSLPVAVEAPGGAGVDRQVFCGNAPVGSGIVEYAALMRFAFRSSLEASYAVKDLGFRCVVNGEGSR